MDLYVITPSRGRPERLAKMVDAVIATRYLDTRVWVCVDADDPTVDRYREVAASRKPHMRLYVGPRGSLAEWTNAFAERLVGSQVRYVASLGDDHIPRTPGWDEQLVKAIEAMDGPGWAYGDDRLQGERIPTAWVQSTELVQALGWMMLPGCEHLCVDSAVRDLGRAAGRLAYLPQVVIEHMHPSHPAGPKAEMDDTYAQGNSELRNVEDIAAYRRWLGDGLERDAATVRALAWPAVRLQDSINEAIQRHAHVEA